ncbi:DUF1330 domain-containing protein [Maricaulis sp.]|uniref:DUF1330 domain-containing protein n=1 Tax=Maricaulis sp. TaxID=1486257 RepID=UPI003A926EE1
MQVINEVLPTDPKQIEAMMQPGPAGPVFMVNLLKFRDKAEYPDGRETALTGREAYNIYGKAIMKVLPEFGGKLVFVGNTTFLALGQVEELWDEVAIIMYPDRGALLRMSLSPAWQAIAVHREAGLKGQLNIETVMPPALLAGLAKGAGA